MRQRLLNQARAQERSFQDNAPRRTVDLTRQRRAFIGALWYLTENRNGRLRTGEEGRGVEGQRPDSRLPVHFGASAQRISDEDNFRSE